MKARLTLSALAAAIALLLAPSAFAQAKSNIQDDPNSSSCTQNCVDAGYEWAVANAPASNDDCKASNEDFADGCKHWVEEQAEQNAPPVTDDSSAPPPSDDDVSEPPPGDAAPPPTDDSSAPPADDNSAPPSDDPPPPPSNG
jgi:hypothetical protein